MSIRLAPWVSLGGLWLSGLALGCRSPSDARSEPPCDCPCAAPATKAGAAKGGDASSPTTTSPTTAPSASSATASGGPPTGSDAARTVSDALVEANRKMLRGDGAGCLADLDRARNLDPKLEAHMAVVRAQCEMLIGQCQIGKVRAKNYYLEETGLGPDQAERMAESIASMRCRGGDSSERDRFLVAAQQLSEAAYMEKKTPAYCKERISLLRELGARVPTREFDDGQVSGTKQALFYTAAACYARAGDCTAAYAVYEELFPKEGFPAGVDAQTKKTVIRTSFDSSVERCRRP